MQTQLNKKNIPKYTIIVGCGKLGANLANRISEIGGDVLILDKDKEAFRRLSPFYGGMSVVGDALELDKLKEIKIDKAFTLLVVTNDDNTNSLVAQMAMNLFSVKHVIARVLDREKECIFNSHGIQTFCPVTLSQERIEQLLSNPVPREAEADGIASEKD